MLKAVLVILAVLMPLQQASGQGIEINLNIGGNTGGSGTSDKSQDAVIAELLKQTDGLYQDTATLTDTWLSQLDILDMSDTGRSMVIALLLEQNKDMQKQIKNLEGKHDDLQTQVKNLTADLCLTKKTCCNKTLTCPSSYERFCEKHDMCYKFSTEVKTYVHAKSACQAANGRLAMPKDKATNDFLAKQFKTRYLHPRIPVWIGLTDQATEGSWVWEDGTPLAGWSNWDPLSPKSGSVGAFFNYAGMGYSLASNTYQYWADYPSTSSTLYYVCEVKATAATP